MEIERVGNKLGVLTSMVLFSTIFYFVLSLKFNWLTNYFRYYDIPLLGILIYGVYLISKKVSTKWKK